MSKYFCKDPQTGQFEDIIYRRRGSNDWYFVYLGNRLIGQISGPDNITGWAAISHAQGGDLRGLRLVRGFKTRWMATDYLLDVGVRPPYP